MSRNKPVSKEVRKALPLLKLIAKIPDSRIRRYNLKQVGGDKTVFNAMKEISGNYLKGGIKLNPSQNNFLSRRENLKVLKKFHCKKTENCSKSRQKIIEQTGGILPILIPAAATVIDLLLSKFIKNDG